MGVILPGDDIVETVYKSVKKCYDDGLVDEGDIVCVTESVVAKSQNNFVNLDYVAEELRKKLAVSENDHLGVLYPIVSRNRLAQILKGIARSVKDGKVTVQLSYPTDEVGNQTIPKNSLYDLGKTLYDKITLSDLAGRSFPHPVTGVDYIKLYYDTIRSERADPDIFLCNNPREIIEHKPDGIIVSNIHERKDTKNEITRFGYENCITLQEICNDKNNEAWSEWGLLGSNLSYGENLKLAPREGNKVAEEIQQRICRGIGKKVEVVIYGDGAYKDPSTGIFELADPMTFFGLTGGLENVRRTGVKYKWLADNLHSQGKSRDEIERKIENMKEKQYEMDDVVMEGTTPRRLPDIVSSLADLVSGSADTGTPVVIVKGMLPN